MSDVTVVISNYNYGRFLSAAIDSCLAQTYQCSVVVVDDASTDNSWSLIKEYHTKYGIKGVLLNKNSGGNSRGKNVGIALSETPFVVCLDSDDMLLPESVEVRRKFLEDHQEFDFLHGCMIRLPSMSPYRQCMAQVSKRLSQIVTMNGFENPAALPPNDIAWYRGIAASTVMARRTLYERFGLYDERCGKEDREMWYRWLYHGGRRGYMHRNVSIYRNHPQQITRNPQRKKPQVVDAYFQKVIEIRKELSRGNTLFLGDFKPHDLIADIKEVS
jgi:glycosyltransferase involved in cell wall biosynthesis